VRLCDEKDTTRKNDIGRNLDGLKCVFKTADETLGCKKQGNVRKFLQYLKD
jgi:hypothetical protein